MGMFVTVLKVPSWIKPMPLSVQPQTESPTHPMELT